MIFSNNTKDRRDVNSDVAAMSIKKGIFYVFLANAINMVINLLTAFLLPKYLSVDTYANIKLFTLYVTYLGILHLGYSDGMYLRAGGKSLRTIDVGEAKKEFDTFKLFQIVMSILMMGISLAINNLILLLCSLVVLPVGVSNYVRSFYTAIGEFKKYSRYTNINTLMVFLINVILLFIIKTNDSMHFIIAYIVIYFLYWLFVEHELRVALGKPKYKLEFKKYYLKENIRSGIFLMTANFCNVIFTSIDRLFVKGLIDMAHFAYYSFAASVENLLNIFISPISTTMYNYFCREKRKSKVIMIKKYSLLLSASIVILVFPAEFIIRQWLPRYLDSISVLFFLVAAQYTAILIKIVHVNLYKSRKQQKKYFGYMLCIIGVSIVLNLVSYLLFKSMIAIAIATLITNMIWLVVGEIDLREYALRMKDYSFFIINLAAFLICGLMMGPCLGACCYMLTILINSCVFEFDLLKELYLKGKNYLNKNNGENEI